MPVGPGTAVAFYNACGVPVYFVRDEWYQQHVDCSDEPRSGRADDTGHAKDKGKGNGNGNGHGKGHGRD